MFVLDCVVSVRGAGAAVSFAAARRGCAETTAHPRNLFQLSDLSAVTAALKSTFYFPSRPLVKPLMTSGGFKADKRAALGLRRARLMLVLSAASRE